MKKLNYFLLFAFLNIFSIEIGAMKRKSDDQSCELDQSDKSQDKKQKQEVLRKEKKIDQLIRELPSVLNQIILEYLGSNPQKISEVKIDPKVTEICHFKDDMIFVVLGNGQIETWDITGKFINILIANDEFYNHTKLRISPDKNKLVFQDYKRNSCIDTRIKLLDLHSRECINISNNNDDVFHCFLGNNQIVLSNNMLIKIYNLDNQEYKEVGSINNFVHRRIYPLENNNKFMSISSNETPSRVLALMDDPDGDHGPDILNMVFWDLNNGRHDVINVSSDQSFNCFSLLDNNQLALGTSKGVQIWDLTNKQCINNFLIDESICSLSKLENNILVLTSGRLFSDKIMRLWDLNNGKCISSNLLNNKKGWAFRVLYIKEDNTLVVASTELITVWDLNRQYDYLDALSDNIEN